MKSFSELHERPAWMISRSIVASLRENGNSIPDMSSGYRRILSVALCSFVPLSSVLSHPLHKAV